MTVLERVKSLVIERSPHPICDDCIANKLDLTVRQHANHKTRELANEPDFDRRVGMCGTCRGENKKVIRYAGLKAVRSSSLALNLHSTLIENMPGPARQSRASLTVDKLIAGGFEYSGRWVLSKTGDLELNGSIPIVAGVYAFAKDGIVLYVGVATKSLNKRLYFYSKPGRDQRTNQRLNAIIRTELRTTPHLDIYTAILRNLEWKGFPIHGSAGLERGLIEKFDLRWNIHGQGSIETK